MNVEKRSLNWEVVDILKSAMELPQTSVQDLIAQIDDIHPRINTPQLSEKLLQKAKSEGRRDCR